MRKKNIDKNIIDRIKYISEDNKVKILIKDGVTNTINIKEGIHQGDVLSSSLFYKIINQIIKDVKKKERYMMGNYK